MSPPLTPNQFPSNSVATSPGSFTRAARGTYESLNPPQGRAEVERFQESHLTRSALLGRPSGAVRAETGQQALIREAGLPKGELRTDLRATSSILSIRLLQQSFRSS